MVDLNDLSIVVTIHDQDLLQLYEAEGKFAGFGVDVTYLFVGMGDAEAVRDRDNVVIARDLADNIEDHKYLVDFTAWYACIRNALPLRRFVCLLQYDVILSDSFARDTAGVFATRPEAVIGYSPVRLKDRNFIRDNMGAKPLFDACRDVYGLDAKAILKAYIAAGLDDLWPATNNVAMSHEALSDFVRWFTPLARRMGNVKPAGHAFERAIKLHSILSGRGNAYLPGVLEHYQLNSHETQDYASDVRSMYSKLTGKIG